MKLRILNNSIRFRLSMSDLDTLKIDGTVMNRLPIGDKTYFSFGIETDTGSSEIHVKSIGNNLCFSVPEAQIVQLHQSDDVGIYKTLTVSDQEVLHLTIEKDFKCLTPRSEDETDLFPNPREHH